MGGLLVWRKVGDGVEVVSIEAVGFGTGVVVSIGM